jgi:hypothetical protein
MSKLQRQNPDSSANAEQARRLFYFGCKAGTLRLPVASSALTKPTASPMLDGPEVGMAGLYKRGVRFAKGRKVTAGYQL